MLGYQLKSHITIAQRWVVISKFSYQVSVRKKLHLYCSKVEGSFGVLYCCVGGLGSLPPQLPHHLERSKKGLKTTFSSYSSFPAKWQHMRLFLTPGQATI